MEYTKQTWTAPTGTGLSRYAKSGETETHVELALDPVNLTNSPTPFTMARMAYIEEGIAKAYDTAPPTPWAQYSGKDIPQLPDNLAGTTYKRDNDWTNTDGWTATRGTVSVGDNKLICFSTDTAFYIQKSGFSFSGESNRFIYLYVSEVPAGNNTGELYYATSGHEINLNYYKSFNITKKGFYILDMSVLRAGDNDWITSTITALRFVFGNQTGQTFIIKSIYIGTGAYDRLVFDNSYHYRHLLNNAVVPTPQGLYFNGATSYLRSKEMVTLPDVFTFRAVVNCTVKESEQTIFDYRTATSSDGNLFLSRGANTNNISLAYYNTSTGSTNIPTVGLGFFTGLDNTDTVLEFVIDFSINTIKIYRNNTLFQTTTLQYLKRPNIIQYLRIGINYVENRTTGFLGYMRNICFYDTALTDTQRNWLAQGNTPPILYDVTNYETEGYVSIQDADGTNTGVETDVDSNGNRILKLPATIKANVTGNVSGNAGTATKLDTAREINGVLFDGSANITITDSTKSPTSHASSATTYGVSSEANYGHAKASTVAGSANGTASKGTTPTIFAQSNHVHPLQTSVSGNASTADKWKTARNITISDADGTNTGAAVSVDGSENETLKLPATIKANVSGNADTASKANVRVSLRHGNTWFAKTWTGLTDFDGERIWTDGENIYHSDITQQFVLNKTTATWVVKTWTGLTDFIGNYIWTDGENIYHSNGTSQLILNKTTSTWTAKIWVGLTLFDGNYIWTDGENIYYSSGTEQFVLNKTTPTWTAKTWTGLTVFISTRIWTDGENIYFSSGTTQYVLNKTTSTWVAKTWTGLTDFNGSEVWTDGENIYYSNGTSQLVLNKATSTWVAKTWTGLTDFIGYNIWTDGENIYYSYETSHYVLPATRHNYVDDDKYNSLFGTVTKCICSTLSARFVFRNE